MTIDVFPVSAASIERINIAAGQPIGNVTEGSSCPNGRPVTTGRPVRRPASSISSRSRLCSSAPHAEVSAGTAAPPAAQQSLNEPNTMPAQRERRPDSAKVVSIRSILYNGSFISSRKTAASLKSGSYGVPSMEHSTVRLPPMMRLYSNVSRITGPAASPPPGFAKGSTGLPLPRTHSVQPQYHNSRPGSASPPPAPKTAAQSAAKLTSSNPP